ncbi:unnamed protein product [Caenorhabditis angaria]|uniref:Nuclear receptor domain-containing protein n=1 Tax=Caenorhabditis angaria TaxID=860376 RepID=A0A9P1N7Y8_9PELO|nr:unnamed protein product [Caenorhabditis angaria]
MTSCEVCGARVIESHFGAMVCRSCSAFFRRYVLTKKKRIICKAEQTCLIHHNVNRMCRFCRMKKCLQVGMAATRINDPIISKSTDKILAFMNNYPLLQDERAITYGKWAGYDKKINFATTTTIMEADYRLSRNHIERSFKEFICIRKNNQNALFDNFYSLLMVAESAYNVVNSGTTQNYRAKTGHETLPMDQYFLGENKNTKLTDVEINRLFEPFWMKGVIYVITPLMELKLDFFEFTAILGLMLFDGSSKGIDDDCVEICYKIRNIIFREISAYHRENKHSRSFDRMADIMYALTTLQCAFFFWVSITAKQFHYNFRLILSCIYMIHCCDNFIIIILKLILIFRIDDENLTNMWYFAVLMHLTIMFVMMAMCVMPFLIFERFFATLYLSDYEQKERKHIAPILITCMISCGIISSYCVRDKANTAYVLLTLSVFNVFAISALLYMRIYNKKQYNKSHNLGNKQYSLTKRFQISENIKTLKLLTTIIFYMGFMDGLVLGSILISSFDVDQKTQAICTIVLDVCIFTYSNSLSYIIICFCEKWKKLVYGTICKSGCAQQTNVQPLRDSFGTQMNERVTLESHFKSLQNTWK